MNAKIDEAEPMVRSIDQELHEDKPTRPTDHPNTPGQIIDRRHPSLAPPGRYARCWRACSASTEAVARRGISTYGRAAEFPHSCTIAQDEPAQRRAH